MRMVIDGNNLDGKRRLKVGCMDEKVMGYIHLDIEPDAEPDIVADARRIPLETSSIDEVLCNNVLEHIPDTLNVMREFHRVLKPKGRLKITVPHANNPNFWTTPDHYKGFTYGTFNQFWQEGHRGYPTFRCVKRRLVMRSKFLQPLADRFAVRMEYLHWIFHLDSVEAELEAIK